MKRIAYIVAALIAVVGCTKKETAPETAGTHDISVYVKVAGDATKVAFDGDSHIKFEKGDAFYAAIAKKEAPAKGIQVAKQKGAAASRYYSIFSIDNFEAAEPSFSGALYSIVDADFADEYLLYGIFPSSYVNGDEEDLTQWTFKVPDEQASTQTSWEGKADGMLINPTVISTSNNTHDDKYGEYTTDNSGEKVQFGHLFGFGKMTFADVPEEYKDCVVKKITIKAVGEKKDIAGTFYVDVTKSLDEIGELSPRSSRSSIILSGDGTTTVSKYTAWFVANPGTYDVEITVSTGEADFVFTRSGLTVSRGKITEPVVHFGKSAGDSAISHNVKLDEGEIWTVGAFSYSNCITSSSPSRSWGTGDKKMNFSVTYPNSVNGNYPSYFSISSKYVQGLSNKPLLGGELYLSSEAEFSGMTQIKVNLGVYTEGATADFTLQTVSGGKTVEIGKTTVSGTNKNLDGKDFFFVVPESAQSGKLVLKVDNLSNSEARPYVGTLVINPDAEIVFEAETIKLEKAASAGEIVCGVYAAKGEPTVTVSSDAASWLTGVSYKDGKISYNVSENTGAKRTATITVTAKGITEVSKSVTLVQASATAVEYKLAFTAKDFLPFVEAKKAELDAAGTTYGEYDSFPVSGTVKATAADGSGKSVNVGFTASKVYLTKCTEAKLRAKSDISFTDEFGEIKSIVVSSDYKAAVSGWGTYPVINLSKDGSSYAKFAPTSVTGSGTDDAPYQNVLNSGIDEYSWFKVTSDNALYYYGFEVTFVAD